MSTPPVDPRVRERWIAARRAEGRRRLRIVLGAAVTVLALAVAWAAVASPFLDVDHVDVAGSVHATPVQIGDAAGIHRGDAMVLLDAGAARARLDSLPWVLSARVKRNWPGTVAITVRERSPVAWVARSAGAVVVDGTGRVLERVGTPPTDLPQVVAPRRVPPVGAVISPTAGARVAGRLKGLVRAGTRRVVVTRHGVVLVVASGLEIRLGQPSAVMTKIRAALAVLRALDGQATSYVDVSVPSNPVAGPPS